MDEVQGGRQGRRAVGVVKRCLGSSSNGERHDLLRLLNHYIDDFFCFRTLTPQAQGDVRGTDLPRGSTRIFTIYVFEYKTNIEGRSSVFTTPMILKEDIDLYV